MGRFTQISQTAFEEMQRNAGVIVKGFDPSNPVLDRANIVCATTGGITVNCKPSFTDLGEDVDNCPNNTKELKEIDDYDCSLSTTALGTSPESIKMELGCADIDPNNTSRIVPRRSVKQSDFMDSIWWVGDRADGGFVAAQLLNALSTEGFSLKTQKKGKGQTALTLMGHASINSPDTVPMIFYSIEGDNESNSIVLDKSSLTVAEGNDATIVATTVPESATVTWQSLNTAVATVTSGGVVTGVSAGTTTIIASFTDSDGVTFPALCTVTVTEVAGEG